MKIQEETGKKRGMVNEKDNEITIFMFYFYILTSIEEKQKWKTQDI